jgi:hypothetical protein
MRMLPVAEGPGLGAFTGRPVPAFGATPSVESRCVRSVCNVS